MQHILVLRFSAMGDVALVLPVLKRVLALNPNVQISIATQAKFCFLFEGVERCTALPVNLQKEYKGIGGLLRLKKHLSFKKFDFIVDVHDVLRTRFLRYLFKSGSRIITFTKGRNEKNKYLARKSGDYLMHTTQRYLDAFAKAGLHIDNQFSYPCFEPTMEIQNVADTFFNKYKSKRQVGFAPFAAHATKTLPSEKIEEVLNGLSNLRDITVFVFAGPEHQEIIEKLVSKFSIKLINTYELRLPEQLALMKHLDKMIAVDSANMHFAALQGVEVISIWGATVPEFGFGPLPSANHQIIENKNLSCRPCSVYGKKDCTNTKCYLECMKSLDLGSLIE